VPMREGAVWGGTPRAKRDITMKQRRYCAGRMRGLSRIAAARAAGYGLSAPSTRRESSGARQWPLCSNDGWSAKVFRIGPWALNRSQHGQRNG